MLYHFNAHGDTIALSDSTGTLVAQYTYDPWGTLTSTTNPSLPNPYLYCGAYGVRWDSDLGLYLMGARWYNPATGRFLTRDAYPQGLLCGRVRCNRWRDRGRGHQNGYQWRHEYDVWKGEEDRSCHRQHFDVL